MPRYRLTVEYDGTEYRGWQRQPGEPTIQEHLEIALSTACRCDVAVVGSGRTDSGVHARGQVAHFDVPHEVDADGLRHSLNGLLPADIAVIDVTGATADFHARYDARLRRYRYYVSVEARALDRRYRVRIPGDVDFEAMNQAAVSILGRHDFSSFCRTQSETENRVCEVTRAAWVAEERPGDWYFAAEADRFLHGMVRALVGTLLEVGRRKRPISSFVEILAERDRAFAGPASRAAGLVLHEVVY